MIHLDYGVSEYSGVCKFFYFMTLSVCFTVLTEFSSLFLFNYLSSKPFKNDSNY